MKYYFFLGLAAISYYFYSEPEVQIKNAQLTSSQIKPKKTSMEKKLQDFPPQVVALLREPATEASPREMKLAKFKPKKNLERISANWEVLKPLPNGLNLIKDVYTMATDDFSDSLGEVVAQRGSNTFFKAQSRPQNVANVAYDPQNNAYFPVSSVLKLEGVTPDKRSRILATGLSEYFYAENAQTLFVQSTHSELLATFEHLVAAGHSPEVEVFRGFHQTR